MGNNVLSLRTQALLEALSQKGDLTITDAIRIKQSTRMLLADRLLPALFATATGTPDPMIASAIAILKRWDRTAEANSVGSVLFERWIDEYARDSSVPKSPVYGGHFPAFATEWSRADPLNTPRGLLDPKAALTVLKRAAEGMLAEYGTLDIAWGHVHRIQLVTRNKDFQNTRVLVDLPSSGASDPFGGIRVVNYRRLPTGGKQVAFGGDGYVFAVDFHKDVVRGWSNLAYGNFSRPGSPHIGDQAFLFGAKRLHAVARTAQQIKGIQRFKEAF